MAVFRLDVAELASPRVDDDGVLHVEAIATRAGVFEYRDASGVRYEYRPEDEVFSERAMSSLRGAPVTIGHVDMVTPQNVRHLRVGVVEGEPRRDDALMIVQLRLDEPSTIDQVLSGTLRELSLGYRCDVEQSSGFADGKRYDMIQKNHKINHVALLPAGKARAGSVAAIRLDAAEEQQPEKKPEEKKDAEQAEQAEQAAEDATEAAADVAEAAADVSEDVDVDLSAQEIESLRARVAELEALAASALSRAEAAEAAVSAYARAQLESEVAEVLPEERTDGLSELELRQKVIGAYLPKVRLDSQAPDYVRGIYTAALSVARAGSNKQVAGAAGAQVDPVVAARQERDARLRNAWKGPQA